MSLSETNDESNLRAEMDSSRSISEVKSAFIRSQVRTLSENLELPGDWKNYAPDTEDGELGEKVIDDVLHKVNAAAKRHHRVVYSSQAIHHVARQIANLYWSSVHQEAEAQTVFSNTFEKTANLTRHAVIAKLPLDIESQGATEEENARYQQLRQDLVDGDRRRQQKQQYLEQLRHLQRLTEPFKNPQNDVQPNLITRDGELIQELEKMRMLVARVGGRIAQQKKDIDTHENLEYLLPGSKRKLDALLDLDV